MGTAPFPMTLSISYGKSWKLKEAALLLLLSPPPFVFVRPTLADDPPNLSETASGQWAGRGSLHLLDSTVSSINQPSSKSPPHTTKTKTEDLWHPEE